MPGQAVERARPAEFVVNPSVPLPGLVRMQDTVLARRGADPTVSYSAELMADRRLVQRKIMEESFEVCLELAESPVDRRRLEEEAADLVYHLTVALVGAGSSLEAVDAVLSDRNRR